ncbi:BgTH12-07803 [Blumeria graminis f. sp. triticale]|uniref:Bgt-50245 n=2 Tax=Blumeria graminis TaxID=34373 RepID=A0A9X9QH40_BLUGR|nr:BgTH12-07803 [Blumeria graminis f. sp. triticale]VDB96435.1 Bgt-50245 [Blumeria graminis f. sp. tritici]
MKFLSAEYYAAWAGLLLLAPAVYAGPHFKCGHVIAFTLIGLENSKFSNGFWEAESDDPRGPNGEEYLSHRFRALPSGGKDTCYLAQLINEYPFFRVFQRTTEVWEPCRFLKH